MERKAKAEGPVSGDVSRAHISDPARNYNQTAGKARGGPAMGAVQGRLCAGFSAFDSDGLEGL